MDAFISGLCSSLGSEAFWTVFLAIIPFLAITFLFGLGKALIEGIIYQITKPDDKYTHDELKEILDNKGKEWDL